MCVIGGVEIDPGTDEEQDEGPSWGSGRPEYRDTARCPLIARSDRPRVTLEREIRAREQPGSPVWTE